MRHDYQDLVNKGICDDRAPAPSDNGGDRWKLSLALVAVLAFLGWAVK